MKPAPSERTKRRSKQKGIRAALDEIGLTDPLTGKRPLRKPPITVKALRERRRG
jgi:hypothetical protein